MIDAVQENCKWHFGRMSHGRQINDGLKRLEEADFTYSTVWPNSGGYLPYEEEAFCIYTSAVSPGGYWRGSGIDVTRSVLNGTPALNISGYCWCTELNTVSESYVNDYLTMMCILESEYPDVDFIYFTGTAEYNGGYGYNRSVRNEQIRQYCIANNKILFDFEDLDSWWYNPDTEEWEHSTYEYNGQAIPVEHPELAGSDIDHTSFESCEQKGKALWWLMAMIQGWEGTLDISITSFSGNYKDGAVFLDWEISADETVLGFNIYRSDDGGENFFRINSSIIIPHDRPGYIDNSVTSYKTYLYRIGAIGAEREFISTEIRILTAIKPILQLRNYPNPCNPSTNISFSIDSPCMARLAIYDVSGRKVITLLDEHIGAGTHLIAWDGTNSKGSVARSGVYFYRLTAGKKSRTNKLLLMR